MNEFEKFLEENNYEDDLEFQLCDLEFAFNAGKELQWKPNKKQIHAFEQVYEWYNNDFAPSETLTSLYNDLKKLEEE